VSSPLAIAGVTAVLRDLLDNGLIDRVLPVLGMGFTVSASAPDAIRLEDTNAPPRLNVFLHQVTPNPSYRNMDLPSRDFAGRRLTRPPLALDLHYLVTAYGTSDLQAEVLLGYAMQLLHETPVLARDAIRTALNPPNSPATGDLLPPVYRALRSSDLADQIEQIKITQAVMNTEEMSKLWTALQAHYRPTASYQVSVVLIESTTPALVPFPVLTPKVTVQGSTSNPYAELQSITLPNAQVVAVLGDSVVLNGSNLDGSQHALLLSNPSIDLDERIAPADSVTSSSVGFTLQDLPDLYPAGTHSVSLELLRPGEDTPRASNELELSIVPKIVTLPATVHLDAEGTATISLTCTPKVRPTQHVSLIVGEREILADPIDVPTSAPTFAYRGAPAGGPYRVRLRVDGVDSLVVDRSKTPPTFFGPELAIAP
jgi:hypothetical protein